MYIIKQYQKGNIGGSYKRLRVHPSQAGSLATISQRTRTYTSILKLRWEQLVTWDASYQTCFACFILLTCVRFLKDILTFTTSQTLTMYISIYCMYILICIFIHININWFVLFLGLQLSDQGSYKRKFMENPLNIIWITCKWKLIKSKFVTHTNANIHH